MEERRGTREVHRRITEQIAGAVAKGAPKFEMPWHRSGPALQRPANVVSTKRYRGVNVLALWVAAQMSGYATGYWGTYRQWTALGAQVRKGEQGTMTVFYKEVSRRTSQSDEEEPETYLMALSSFVFNAAQVEGWEPPRLKQPDLVERIGGAELFIQTTGAQVKEGGDVARYLRHLDRIEVPARAAFIGTATSTATDAYYATLFHELIHWSGHERRLNRDLSKRFGDEAYAIEELVAELGAAFLCADLNIANSPRSDHASYIASWLRVLNNDPRAIFSAAAKANAAAEYLATLTTQASVQ